MVQLLLFIDQENYKLKVVTKCRAWNNVKIISRVCFAWYQEQNPESRVKRIKWGKKYKEKMKSNLKKIVEVYIPLKKIK